MQRNLILVQIGLGTGSRAVDFGRWSCVVDSSTGPSFAMENDGPVGPRKGWFCPGQSFSSLASSQPWWWTHGARGHCRHP